MKSKAAVRRIVEALKKLYPDAMCSLQYQKDYELLFAVRLSAQCTDARVNMVTPALLSRLLPVLSQMNRNESSETSALLYALQPFLRDKRRDKVARAAQLAKLIHLAKVFLTTREE